MALVSLSRAATAAGLALVGAVVIGCDAGPTNIAQAAPTSEPDSASEPPAESCEAPLPVYEKGKQAKTACPGEIARAGLTVLDLSDEWVQALFSEAGEAGGPSYRETMIELANERFGEGPEWDRPRADRHLEFYGVFPSVGVVRRRLLDDERHRCHDGVDDASLAAFEKPLGPWRKPGRERTEKNTLASLTADLERARKQLGLESIDALRKDRRFADYFRRYDQVRVPVEALAAVQAHLRCDGLLDKYAEDRVYDWPTTESMQRFQRKHMIVSWGVVDDLTRRTLLADSRELDYRALLRVLRERVIDATGLIEDGSARNERGKVFGRELDPEEFNTVRGHEPIDGGAPDLVSAATQAAAEALGWTSPEAVRRFFEAAPAGITRSLRVAVRLPPVPDYHGEHMELRAEIDRGDVYYDYPYTRRGKKKKQEVERRPALTLYAKHGGRDIALVRWPSTIGGWKPESVEGRVVMKYKGSVEGERIWRDLIVAPAWVPAESVPPKEIVRKRWNGRWATQDDLFGPGYASAYGLMMIIHHRVAKLRNAPEPVLHDEGIRTHGSVSYQSIQRGYSHGCHRLYNHMALRLGSFLLRHRRHARHGALRIDYKRTFSWKGQRLELDFPSRGYRYELTPPVPVEVLKGRIMTRTLSMPTYSMPLPPSLRDDFGDSALAD